MMGGGCVAPFGLLSCQGQDGQSCQGCTCCTGVGMAFGIPQPENPFGAPIWRVVHIPLGDLLAGPVQEIVTHSFTSCTDISLAASTGLCHMY